MSDLVEFVKGLFGVPNDPKELTLQQLIDKEAQNVKNQIVKLPPVVQPFLDVEVDTVQTLADAALPFAGTAIGAMISEAVPGAEGLFLGVLAQALGSKNAASVEATVNAAAQTPAGQAIIKQMGTAWQAIVAHLTAQASAGALIVPATPQPQPALQPAPSPVPPNASAH